MSTRLDENLGAVGYDNLFNGVNPPAEVTSVKVKAGQGVLKRGSVLLNDGETHQLFGANEAEDATSCVILADDIDTGTTEGEAVNAVAYRTGHFNTNSLITANGYEITADVKEAFRMCGILISDAVEI